MLSKLIDILNAIIRRKKVAECKNSATKSIDVKRAVDKVSIFILFIFARLVAFIETCICLPVATLGSTLLIVGLAVIIVIASVLGVLSDELGLDDLLFLDDKDILWIGEHDTASRLRGSAYNFPESDILNIEDNYVRNCWKIISLANKNKADVVNPVASLVGVWGHEMGFRIYSYTHEETAEQTNDVYTHVVNTEPKVGGTVSFIAGIMGDSFFGMNPEYARKIKDDDFSTGDLIWGDSAPPPEHERGNVGFIPDEMMMHSKLIKDTYSQTNKTVFKDLKAEMDKYGNIKGKKQAEDAIKSLVLIGGAGAGTGNFLSANYTEAISFYTAFISMLDGAQGDITWGDWSLTPGGFDMSGLRQAIRAGGLKLKREPLASGIVDVVKGYAGDRMSDSSYTRCKEAFENNEVLGTSPGLPITMGLECLIAGNDLINKVFNKLGTSITINTDGTIMIPDATGSLGVGEWLMPIAPSQGESPSTYRGHVAMDIVIKPIDFLGTVVRADRDGIASSRHQLSDDLLNSKTQEEIKELVNVTYVSKMLKGVGKDNLVYRLYDGGKLDMSEYATLFGSAYESTGREIVIRHADVDGKTCISRYYHLYAVGAELNSIIQGASVPSLAGAGSPVKRGDIIGLAGDSGQSFNYTKGGYVTHLHVQVEIGGQKVKETELEKMFGVKIEGVTK